MCCLTRHLTSCEKCVSTVNFARHLKLHEEEDKKLKCNCCNYSTAYEYKMKYHVAGVHEKATTMCCICSITVTESLLNKHMSSEHGVSNSEPKEQCAEYKTRYSRVCGLFISKRYMGEHILRVHEKKKRCKICLGHSFASLQTV